MGEGPFNGCGCDWERVLWRMVAIHGDWEQSLPQSCQHSGVSSVVIWLMSTVAQGGQKDKTQSPGPKSGPENLHLSNRTPASASSSLSVSFLDTKPGTVCGKRMRDIPTQYNKRHQPAESVRFVFSSFLIVES